MVVTCVLVICLVVTTCFRKQRVASLNVLPRPSRQAAPFTVMCLKIEQRENRKPMYRKKVPHLENEGGQVLTLQHNRSSLETYGQRTLSVPHSP